MSIRLRDLIKAVRACKTAAEEREVIAKESAALREAFREQDQSCRHRNVAKLMYIHMLGYPTHFGQMETLKLIAGSGFPEKRMGYLGLMILLDERQEVLMLVTNSVKMDLNNTKNMYIVGLALVALGNICSAEMARDLAPDVEKLMDCPAPYIRKKAALCAVRIVKKVPELLEQFVDKAVDLLNDRNQAVMLCGVTLMLQILELDASHVDKYRPAVPTLCRILRSLLQTGVSPEHDIGGITNPFLQVKLLRLLRLLGRGHAESSDAMSDILAQVASNIEANRNAGNAILYECVQTIMGIESIGGLRVLAINILGRFLANKDNNIRYVALNTLAKVVSVDTQAVQRHRATIVECVKDADVSIRRRALELVYSLVNESNIRTLTRELLDYLAVSDAEFKPDLTAKICMLIQRFAPDRRWYFDQLLAVMLQAGAYVKDEVARAMLVHLTNTPELQAYATRAFYRALAANVDAAAPALLQTALWVIGEYGEMLLPSMGGPLLEGEAPLVVSDSEAVSLLETVLRRHRSEPAAVEHVLTAAMKLTARLPAQVPRLRATIGRFTTSAQLEVQTRSCEYGKVFGHERIRPQLLERMPALDEAEYLRTNNLEGPASAPGSAPVSSGGAKRTNGTGSAGGAAAPATAAAAAAAAKPATGSDLLGGLDMLGGVSTAAAPTNRALVDDLDALLGGVPAPAPPVAASVAAAGAAPPAPPAVSDDLLNLLGMGPGPSPAVAAAAPAPPADPLAAILGGPAAPAASPAAVPAPALVPSSPAAPVAAAAGAAPTIVAWQQQGLVISFTLVKHVANPAITEVLAVTTNNNLTEVTDYTLQVAVPKFMQIKLEPASGSVLAPRGGTVTQKLYVNNTQHGVKQLVMRLRITFTTPGGQSHEEVAEVANFPPGY
ncbi:hypothetical protein PLESTB_000036100 [Pleodorina starrii]|uniref:AP-1 complex subunit gamma n=1 Tax=Pleodorina starrii TaxID=330485 RepID=A0A9W6B962_9CHLO|nr:hypothetical protein PLESTM_001098000 [Pleodorina starrii]GLC47883.1 hypothetical protein PLESTB_000036100 [Pleodorina starrii]GLC70686.1 hypothetical protein PLESTF_001022400 [Pleodorina starrii]